MSTTASQDRQFIEAVISSSLLETCIEWIADNLNPEDVFSDGDLQNWASENGYEVAD